MDTLDMLIFYSFNLGIFTLVFFIAGMIKPKWPLFFMKEPTRFLVVGITTAMIMVVLTMYGEAIVRFVRNKKGLNDSRW